MTTRLVVQLSDTHVRQPGELAERRVDTAAGLRRAVEAIGRLPQAPEAVFVSGDLVDSGRREQYEHLRELLSPLAAPVHLLPGNHDDRDALREVFAGVAELGRAGDPSVHYAVDFEGLRVVVLDSVVTRQPHGELDDVQLGRLDATLAERPAVPTLVLLHHPPFATHIQRMDDYGLVHGGRGLAAVIARHPQVDRIACGHLHRAIVGRFAGVPVLTAPSTAHALTFDLGADAPLSYTLEPPGFLVHAWSPSGGIASHVVYAHAFDGPHRFGFA